MDIKKVIRNRIKEKYGTIARFSYEMGIPRQTINYILKTGVDTSAYTTVRKILNALDISDSGNIPVIYDEKARKLLEKYSALDEFGKHTVSSVAETEWKRIHPETPPDIIAAFDSINYSTDSDKDKIMIMELIKKAKERLND